VVPCVDDAASNVFPLGRCLFNTRSFPYINRELTFRPVLPLSQYFGSWASFKIADQLARSFGGTNLVWSTFLDVWSDILELSGRSSARKAASRGQSEDRSK
jgi:hypothetical protein